MLSLLINSLLVQEGILPGGTEKKKRGGGGDSSSLSYFCMQWRRCMEGKRKERAAHFGDFSKQERDPFTDLRHGQSIFDKSMSHVHSFCLFTPI